MSLNSIRFQAFTLDLDRFSLHGPGGRLELRPKSFEVLRYLAEHGSRVVSKDELMKAVWPNVAVTDESLTRCISDVRQVLGEDGSSIIKTIPRRGYLFDGTTPVGNGGTAPAEAAPSRPLNGAAQSATRPSIAVLPFTNMSGDPEQDYFSDGLTEDIITDLSKVSGLSVVSRNLTFPYRGTQVKIRQIAHDLSVRFVLEGSVRKVGSRVRVTAQLIEGDGEGHLWADRYDRDLIDVFAIQDEITHAIVDQLKVKLLSEERQAIEQVPTGSADAYGYYLRGRQFLHRHAKPYYALAKRMFEKAVELDPRYARAHAGIADCDSFLFLHYNADVWIEGILETSGRALELDASLSEAHASRGVALSLSQRYDEAMGHFEQAIKLDPNLFEAHYFYARAFFAQGKLDQAAPHFARAAEIRPDDYQALLLVSGIYRSLGREADMTSAAREGVARAERTLALHPENSRAAYLGAIGLATLGEMDRARDWAERALAIDPEDGLAKYNIACFYSLQGDHDRAIDLLLELLPGATNERKRWVRNDSDFDPIRDHPRYRQVLRLIELTTAPEQG